MNDIERRFLVEKCAILLQNVLVEIRALSTGDGRAKQINDLADLTHNVPEFLVGSNDHVLGYLRAGLLDYARKYYPSIAAEKHRYVMLLDMDEATFTDLYRNPSWPCPEPAGVAS